MEGCEGSFGSFAAKEKSLKGGFGPRLRFNPSKADRFQEDGTLREEFAIDVSHVGRRRDRLAESFQLARDVYARFFLAILLADEGTNHSFWIARALTDPNSNVSHPKFCIQMQN